MNCLICNNKTAFFVEKDRYGYQKCPACGLVFVNPQPDERHLQEEVYSKKAGYQKHRKKLAVKESRHIKKILNYLQKTVSNGKLLDVGCSNGDFLFFAKQRGFETYGVEINELTAEIARSRELNVKQGTLKDAHYADNFFDTVFLGDIIEHVKNPKELLVESHRVLKSTGVLVISTPNLDSFWAKTTFKLYKRFNISWSVLTPPHHLFQFSEDNLKQFLTQNGFTPMTAWFRRPPTLLYELGSLHLWGKWKRQKTLKNFFFMFFAFGAYVKLYVLDILITPWKEKDFGMILCSKKIKN
ncbi:MAG: class I SAM-dependent methyltransferase [Parcubacteria group bacterium]|nr:class I SAM-dependent methyltransferase [Parcubacteria group bacterium]